MQTTIKANKEKWGHSVWKQFSRYTLSRLSALPISLPSFVRPGQQREAWPPASLKGFNLLETEGDTHRRPLCGGFAQNLNIGT